VEGFAHLPGPFGTPSDAFAAGRDVLARVDAWLDWPLEVIGDFVLPPADGAPSRDFQTLHLDFGLPLDPQANGDVARFTVLHVAASTRSTGATTRLVPLAPLLSSRAWPDQGELLGRFAAYGASHGARDGARGYVEGSLARIVEAALGDEPVLSSVKADPGFLCGEEFDDLAGELEFFGSRGLDVVDAQIEIVLQPGELLIFDNLALAHGRSGVRQPGELHQRVFGYRSLDAERQRDVRDRVLAAFDR
jgi:hypothetical protein